MAPPSSALARKILLGRVVVRRGANRYKGVVRMGTGRAAVALLIACLLAGCGKDAVPPQRPDLSGVPEHLREAVGGGQPAARVRVEGGEGAAGGGAAASGAAPGGLVVPASKDLVWTDPDNPDAEIPELERVLERPANEPWGRSMVLARRQAMREGKCVMIWFTDSRLSPASKALSAELFGQPEFGAWAEANVVRVMIDIREPDKAEADDQRARTAEYVDAVRKQYKVFGTPTVVMLAPHGEVIKGYRGYRQGGADFLWGQFKQAQRLGEASYKTWRSQLEAGGYRDWQDPRGRKIFAKLLAYQNGQLLLVEPDGSRCKTSEAQLSQGDRLWLAEQKRSRGLR